MHRTFLINSLRNGGAERVLLTLAEQFLRQGDEVTIIALTHTCAYPIPPGVKMVYLSNGEDGNSGLKRMLLIPYYAWKLRHYSRTMRPKIIQSHIFRANFVNVLSRMLGAKHRTQLVNHSVASRYRDQGLVGRFHLWLMGVLYPKADLVVTISQKMLEDLERCVDLNRPAVVIHNPYDTQKIIDMATEKVTEFVFDPSKRYLVTVGRLIPLKQYDDVIRVLATLPSDVELLMVGDDGGEQSKLEVLAQELGVAKRVHWMGQVPNPFKFVARCDLFVSSSRTEGFPNVLIEAMLCRTPVVSSDCISGPREILAPDTDILYQRTEGIEAAKYGLLYPVGDSMALAQAIRRMMEDRNLYTHYQEQGFLRAHAFSVDRIAQEYASILS